jgi:hypothetical protein
MPRETPGSMRGEIRGHPGDGAEFGIRFSALNFGRAGGPGKPAPDAEERFPDRCGIV